MNPPASVVAAAGEGDLVLPAFAEPHAHLDKAFLAERVRNATGDLMGAIVAMQEAHPSITVADTVERAERAARLMLANGTTAIRSHADTTTANGLTAVTALIEVRERLRDVMDIQVCALVGWPCIGPEGAEVRALAAEAIAMGVDVIGGCPHLEMDPAAANELFLGMAAEAGLPVDLHTDETLAPNALALADLAQRVIDSRFPLPVTASHCVSLCVQPPQRQHEIAELVAEAGIHVIALPHTNLYLQGRGHDCAMPRALTAVGVLRSAGVVVAAGADNLQDPFNPVGRGDALETASLMVTAAHLQPDDALASVSDCARTAMGVGNDDWVVVPARTVREAIAFGPAGRRVFRGDRLVAG